MVYLTYTFGILLSVILTSKLFPAATSYLYRCFINTPSVARKDVASQFRDNCARQPFSLRGHAVVDSNPHRYAAQRRTAARHWIVTNIYHRGKEPFAVNLSSSDIRKGTKGNRQIRTMKDHNYYTATSDSTPTTDHDIMAIDDLDHYSSAQLHELLCLSTLVGANLFSYTLKPTAGAFKSDEASIAYNHETRKWETLLPDEATYEDALWDSTKEFVSSFTFGDLDRYHYFFATLTALVTVVLSFTYLSETMTVDYQFLSLGPY
jgi:hypothetical protein